MLRCCHRILLCSAAATTSVSSSVSATSPTAASTASSSSHGLLVGSPAFASFEQWIKTSSSNGINLEAQGVKLVPKSSDSRGMVALRNFREGTTVLSIPMEYALNAQNLSRIQHERQQQHKKAAAVAPAPSYEEVKRVMMSASVRDPVLHQQMYLAVLLAAERVAEDSPFSAYFNVLPHPAVNDREVMQLHKDVLDPLQLIEWDDHQRVFVTACRRLHERWTAAAAASGGQQTVPPLEVLYWAFRTVLSRMHLLPDRGLVPSMNGSKLNYSAYSTLRQVDQHESLTKRVMSSLRGILPSSRSEPVSGGGVEFRLVPTLVPVLDMAGHVSSTNVSVEVQPREAGSCVELQAVTAIAAGEAIGMCVNRSQSVAFTLFRFGFLPV